MQVTVLTHMPFAGKQRKPGESISTEDWEKASDVVRAALVAQGIVRIGGGDLPAGAFSESSTDVIELLQGISAKQDRILGLLGAPQTATKPRTAAAKKRKK